MLGILPSFLISSRSLRFGTQAVAAVMLLSCGGGGGGSPSSMSTPPPSNTFYVGDSTGLLTFSPASLTIATGATVTWVWQGSGHSLDSGSNCSAVNGFSSGGIQNTGFTMTHTFNTPGTYPFFCGVHCGANMKGTITVQ